MMYMNMVFITALKCPLPDITNAQFIPEIVDLDATTLVTCASGYDLVDSTNTIKDEVTLTCGMDQNFQEVLPRCNGMRLRDV